MGKSLTFHPDVDRVQLIDESIIQLNSCAEDISIEQVSLREAVLNEFSSELTQANGERITKERISAGFNPLPRLAEIYKRQGKI